MSTEIGSWGAGRGRGVEQAGWGGGGGQEGGGRGRGQRSGEVGGGKGKEGWEELYLTLHCHHGNDSCKTLTAATSQYCGHQAACRCHIYGPKSAGSFVIIHKGRRTTLLTLLKT